MYEKKVKFHYTSEKSTLSVSHAITYSPYNEPYKMHTHDACELYYFLSGDAYFIVEGTKYPLKEGSLLLFRESEAHKVHISSQLPYERIVFSFDSDLICSHDDGIHAFIYSRDLGQSNLICDPFDSASGKNDTMIHSIVRYICDKNVLDMKIDFDDHLRSALQMILSYAALQTQKADFDNMSKATEAVSESDILVQRMVAYINSNLTMINGLSEFEDKFFFSRSYLNNIFRSAIGSTIWEYIIVKRLHMARDLLRSGKPAMIAANECGFSDYSSFFRQYKRVFNCSPLNDREKKKKFSNSEVY